jgi:hypothetical protein
MKVTLFDVAFNPGKATLPKDTEARANALRDAIQDRLLNEHPAIQGTVLGEVVALYLARFHLQIRGERFESFVDHLGERVPEIAGQLWGQVGEGGRA